MAPTERFAARAERYDRFRPGYPRAVVDLLRELGALAPGAVVADIGSGTGIFAERLLDAGHPVFAVEPNRAMREAAERRLAGRPGFISLAGTAEATTLPDASVDLVVAAQAFHWFDRERTRPEFGRVLRPPRWVALIWNARRAEGSAFLEGYERLLVEHAPEYGRIEHRGIDAASLAPFFGGTPPVERRCANEQRLDLEGLRGRLLSSSYAPDAADPGHAAMVAAMTALFGRCARDGGVVMEYVTRVLVGRLA